MQQHKHWNDDRTTSEKQIAKALVYLVSQINCQRHKQPFRCKKDQQFPVFITICGVPPHPNEFSGLKFPGKTINYYPPCFDPQLSEEQLEKMIKSVSMTNTAEELDAIIQMHGDKVVFIYHSFGGSIVSFYNAKYPQKVKGLISLGGPSIRFYPILKDFQTSMDKIPGLTEEFVRQNYQVVYEMYAEKMKKHRNKVGFSNAYQLLSHTLHNMPAFTSVLFENIRNLPRPMLCIYGNNDTILTTELTEEAASHLLIKAVSQQEISNLAEMQRKPEELSRIQQNFIYFLPGGHSIHVKNEHAIQPLIDQYLTFMFSSADQKSPIASKL